MSRTLTSQNRRPASTSPSRSRRRVAAMAVPALCLGLTGLEPAAATPPSGPYIAQNTASAATVTTPSGTTHAYPHRLRTIAADGTVQVLDAAVTPGRRAAVAVDATTGTARILGGSADAAGTVVHAGDHALVLQRGAQLTRVDPVTGTSTPLVGVPAATDGFTRSLTAVAATAAGALVATVDVTDPGTSGLVGDAGLWRLTAQAATRVATLTGVNVPSLAVGPSGADALVVDLEHEDALSVLHLSADGTTTRTAVTATLPGGFITPEIGYADDGSPVLNITASAGVSVSRLDGEELKSYPQGSRVLLSATDLTAPTSVANPLTKTVRLAGVPAGPVRRGTKVTPTAGATATGVLPAAPVPAVLTLRQGAKARTLTSGQRVTLARNTCFTAASPATLFARAATPVTRCVTVRHQVRLVSWDKKHRIAVVRTSAHRLQVQVRTKRGWVATGTAKANGKGVVRVKVPAGAVRLVAKADGTNGAAVLGVTAR